MKKDSEEKLKKALVIIGWMLIAFALFALIRFILNLN